MARVRGFVAAMVVAAVGGVTLVTSATASDFSRSGQLDAVVVPGGMNAVVGNSLQRPPGAERVAQVPSCARAEFRGNAGAIYVQTSSAGTVAWGIYMYDV